MRVAAALAFVAVAGCSSAAGGSAGHRGPNSSSPAGTGRLDGHVGRYGGPMMPDGHMAVSDSPQLGVPVTATAAHRTYRTTSDGGGRVAFRLPPGRYAVASPGCQPSTVTVRAGRTTTQPIVCAVP
jgi:hypothetical protein